MLEPKGAVGRRIREVHGAWRRSFIDARHLRRLAQFEASSSSEET